MSKITDRIATEVSFGLDGLPKFSVGSFRHFSREERMDKIVASVSQNFSRELTTIIKNAKSSATAKKKPIQRMPAKKKAG